MNLSEKAMLVNLSISQWTARKYDRKVSSEVNAAHGAKDDAGRYNKSLIARESLKDIQRIVNQARIFHYEKTLPWFDEGARILPAAMFSEYSTAMRQLRGEFETVVRDFADAYPSLIDEARIALNGLFNVQDYPPVEMIRSKFDWRVSISPLPNADDFRVQLSDDEIETVRKEIEARAGSAAEMATKDLWERLYKVVSNMADKLVIPDAIFRNSLVENIGELTSMLPKLNITNDANLEDMRRKVESKLAATNPEVLRTDSIVRRETAKDAQALLDAMKGYMG